MATKTAKKNTQVKNIKVTTDNMNKKAINFADNLVDETLATGAEWQAIFAKALKNGTVLLEKQQDFTFETLEAVKGQILKSGFRFKKLFSLETPKNKTAAKKDVKAPKSAKAAIENLDAKTRVKKVAQKVAAVDANVTATIKKSDLKVIEGVGPKLESILNEGGIRTLDQVAKADVKELKAILEAAGSRYKMHDPTTWAQQAELAAAGKTKELKTLQAKLKAGKKAKK